ncbi:hypothetical protein FQN54_000535 [Arachnomyces sp. PD_36]|nr:hypothetical protein FQN54_000535 [Arachnomyces sp. PD_36]
MPDTQELSDFEKQRAANIAERDALLKKLTLENQSSGLFAKTPKKPSEASKSKKKTPVKKIKKEDEAPVPRRTSSRLRGLTADSEVAKRKAENEYQAIQEQARAKRQRVAGDLKLGDIMVGDQNWDYGNLLGTDVILKGVAKPYERTFGEDDVKKTTNKDLKALREKMSGLQLWEHWEPNRIKITPERIYSMSFHPTESKPLVFAGDKVGNLGILDASQKPPESTDDDEDPDPVITTVKPHARTISAMYSHPSNMSTLYTASYDSSIRALDLEKSVAVETYAPKSASDDEPLSGVDMAATDPHVLYFTTLNGIFGRHDTRTSGAGKSESGGTTLYPLSEKKIGGFSLYPSQPHFLATASLDRTMRVWDMRKLSKTNPIPVGEHESRLSVSHAAFNNAGQVATSSYDDSVKIYDFKSKGIDSWKSGHAVPDEEMKPNTVVRHNCQTGRWVTILRPQWQLSPQDSIQRFCIGNMNRFVDIYSGEGQQLAQLSGEGLITAVPAVAVFHHSKNWVVGGTASGKACLWM